MNHTSFTKEELVSRIDTLEKELSEIKESAEPTFNQAAV
jgi:hypothetical protein